MVTFIKQMKRPALCLAALLLALFITGCQPDADGAGDASVPESETSQEPVKEVAVDDIFAAIHDAFGDEYPANGEIPTDLLEAEFGLTPDLYEEARGEMPMISIHNDRVVIAKAAPGKGDQLEKALQEALQQKIEDTLQYPMNIPKTNAAQVVRNGDYVAFLLIGRPNDDLPDIEDPETKAYAESEVQLAVDAFHSVFKT